MHRNVFFDEVFLRSTEEFYSAKLNLVLAA